jgi:hypothetical protein
MVVHAYNLSYLEGRAERLQVLALVKDTETCRALAAHAYNSSYLEG